MEMGTRLNRAPREGHGATGWPANGRRSNAWSAEQSLPYVRVRTVMTLGYQ
jgi:hypothetical protein